MKVTIFSRHLCATRKLTYLAVICTVTAWLFGSCTTTKNAYYFKTLPRDTTINTTVNRLTESVIRKNDQLAITISSLNPAEDALFNAGIVSAAAGAAGGGFQVDINGNIQLHRLGSIHAEGMTRRALKNKIEKDISPWLKDPLVTVNYLNHRITVLGELGSSIIPMPNEQLSVLEVLGSSGTVTPNAKIDNVLIIRETDTGKQFKRLNLEDHSIFTSSWYFLQPNDVVYVEPNDKRLKDEKRARYQQNLGLIITSISFVIFILDRIIN